MIYIVVPFKRLKTCFLTFSNILKFPLALSFSSKFEDDVVKVWDYGNSVEQYVAQGGTAKESVQNQISALHTWLQEKADSGVITMK